MIEETFFHTLKSGENAKFTLRSKIIKNQVFYFANVVGTDLDFYKNLSEFDQKKYLGVDVSDGNQNIVYYKDKNKLKQDIILFYGDKWLKSEI